MLKPLRRYIITSSLLITSSLAFFPAFPVFAADKPKIEAFFNNAEIQKATLSPDGKILAMLVPAKGSGYLQLIALDLETMSPKLVANFSNADIASYSWVNNQRLVYSAGFPLGDLSEEDRHC